jgi:hypothetical protein
MERVLVWGLVEGRVAAAQELKINTLDLPLQCLHEGAWNPRLAVAQAGDAGPAKRAAHGWRVRVAVDANDTLHQGEENPNSG